MPQVLAIIALFGCVSRLYRGSYEPEREVDNAHDCNPAQRSDLFRVRKGIGRVNEEVPFLVENSQAFSAFPLLRTHMQLPHGEPAREPSSLGRLLAIVPGYHNYVHESLSSAKMAQW